MGLFDRVLRKNTLTQKLKGEHASYVRRTNKAEALKEHEAERAVQADLASLDAILAEAGLLEVLKDEETDRELEPKQLVQKFVRSPRNRFGTHSSKGFKGNYALAWRRHFSQVGGGALTGAASGPVRGTVRRTEMIAAAMKPKCNLPKTESIGARGGPKSPLAGSFPESPKDYGLTKWDTPGKRGLKAEDVQLSCKDLAVIKRAALAEVKRRANDRAKQQKG